MIIFLVLLLTPTYKSKSFLGMWVKSFFAMTYMVGMMLLPMVFAQQFLS
jgi:hypothetical protein